MSDFEQISLALVDDSQPLRKLIGAYLSSQGFNVVCQADSGEQLFEQMTRLSMLPDLVLLDANMPGMSGDGTASALRLSYPTIGIMAYSFFDDMDRPDRMLQSGAHDFVSKEATPMVVRDALKALHQRMQK